MSKFIKQFAKDECGATAIEYGLICALIAIAIISILGTLGSSLSNTFTAVNNGFTYH